MILHSLNSHYCACANTVHAFLPQILEETILNGLNAFFSFLNLHNDCCGVTLDNCSLISATIPTVAIQFY